MIFTKIITIWSVRVSSLLSLLKFHHHHNHPLIDFLPLPQLLCPKNTPSPLSPPPAKLTSENIKEPMRDIRRALLEADVRTPIPSHPTPLPCPTPEPPFHPPFPAGESGGGPSVCANCEREGGGAAGGHGGQTRPAAGQGGGGWGSKPDLYWLGCQNFLLGRAGCPLSSSENPKTTPRTQAKKGKKKKKRG